MAEFVALAMQSRSSINQNFAHMPPLRRYFHVYDRSRLDIHYLSHIPLVMEG